MQLPQALPSEGQATGAQVPLTQVPLQHGVPKPQAPPTGAPAAPQTPPLQLWLQQSLPTEQSDPSGAQASAQTPPVQVPLQQSAPTLQDVPSSLQPPQSSPQLCSAWATQAEVQPVWQHEGKTPQTAAVQLEQPGRSGGPSSQGP